MTDSRYDYERQAWTQDGVYVACGHPDACDCYGKAHAGERAPTNPDLCRTDGQAQSRHADGVANCKSPQLWHPERFDPNANHCRFCAFTDGHDDLCPNA